MTLEQIQGMNLQVGDKIEITRDDSQRELVYYLGIKGSYQLRFSDRLDGSGKPTQTNFLYKIPFIKEIKVLEYKK